MANVTFLKQLEVVDGILGFFLKKMFNIIKLVCHLLGKVFNFPDKSDSTCLF